METFTKHREIEEREVFICEICGCKTSSKNFMVDHEKIHNGKCGKFKVGEKVQYRDVEHCEEHGKPYDYYIYRNGIIINIDYDKKTALIEMENGERHFAPFCFMGSTKQ